MEHAGPLLDVLIPLSMIKALPKKRQASSSCRPWMQQKCIRDWIDGALPWICRNSGSR